MKKNPVLISVYHSDVAERHQWIMNCNLPVLSLSLKSSDLLGTGKLQSQVGDNK